MDYDLFVRNVVEKLGGTDNISVVRHDKSTLRFKLYDMSKVQRGLLDLRPIKDVTVENHDVIVKLPKRHVRYSFEALKELPDASVKRLNNDQELDTIWSRLPYFRWLGPTTSKSYFPLFLCLVLIGSLFGLFRFLQYFYM